MSGLIALGACALLPWLVCKALRGLFAVGPSALPAMRERALGNYRRATLVVTLLVLPASVVAGALTVDPSLSSRWPIAAAWFFAALTALTAWTNLALARRTPEEANAMPVLETAGRAVQLSALPILATGLSLLGRAALGALTALLPAGQVIAAALFSVFGVLVVSPWLVMTLRLWPIFPRRIEVDGVSWRLAHLPAPTPFLTHTAALPWLRTALVSDGLFGRAPEPDWRTLVRYEIAGASSDGLARVSRWVLAISASTLAFIAAGTVAADDPGKLVAGSALAVFFTATAGWFANRRPESKLSVDADGPSMRELARSLRSLPPCLGQALPRTSHNPLGPAVYDRLFALGHDPGRRPHS
ncbi:MAG: hypothetical protein WCE62_03995 [Polyangiales bacterium]